MLPPVSETDAGNETGVPQIEVTPSMLEAGLSAYLHFLPEDAPRSEAQECAMLRRVYRAMFSRRRADRQIEAASGSRLP